MGNSKGSIWRKWDLQVQTILDDGYIELKDYYEDIKKLQPEKWAAFIGVSGSEENALKFDSKEYFYSDKQDNKAVCKNYATNFLAFVDNFVDIPGVIGLTDHNYDSPHLLDAFMNASVNSKTKVIPGIEINVQGVHMLIFWGTKLYEKQTYSEGIKTFLAKININNKKTSGVLTVSDKSYTEVIDEVINTNGLILFAHCNSDNGLFQENGKTDRTHLKNFFNYQDFNICQESSKEACDKTSSYIESKKSDLQKPFCFTIASDSRCLKDVFKPDKDGNYCWIKADCSFDGLKQIMYEPDLRIRIQDENPENYEAYSKLKSISIDLPDDLEILESEDNELSKFCINGKYNLNFSNNLTCIIGGRGTGKSTFLHFISNKLDDDTDRLESINSPISHLNLKPSPYTKISELTEIPNTPNRVEIYLQNEIEKTAKDINAMSDLLIVRLHELSQTNSKDDENDLDDLQDLFETKQSEMDEIVETYTSIVQFKNEIDALKVEVKSIEDQKGVIKSDEYIALQQKIFKITEKINKYTVYKKEWDELNEVLSNVGNKIAKLKWNDEEGLQELTVLKTNISNALSALKAKFNTVSKTYSDEDNSGKLRSAKEDLNVYLKSKNLSPENIQNIAGSEEKLSKLKQSLQETQESLKELETQYIDLSPTVDEYKNLYEEYKKCFENSFSSLTEKLNALQDSTKVIDFHLIQNFEVVRNEVIDFVKEVNSDIDLMENVIASILLKNEENSEFLEYCEKVLMDKDKMLEKINSAKADKHKNVLLETFSDENSFNLFKLILQKALYSIENIKVNTLYGGKSLKNTSFGERCGIVISILLIAGTDPIIIDQPEDHLDSKFTTQVLVPLIRKQKLQRQIVFVTRDANIVIGSDSDLIHILDINNERTQVNPTTIENPILRENYIWILDGGADAFKARERKYQIINS
jgi:ABC-type cobalamin/Fe3+-siderophores transport system ATPase subunit